MNTRIQSSTRHEMITGVDLVNEQIRSPPVPRFRCPGDLTLSGHATNAASIRASEQLPPLPGRDHPVPHARGLGVRVDSAAYQGYPHSAATMIPSSAS